MVVDIMAIVAAYQGSPFFCVPIRPRGRGREERGEGWTTKSQGGVTLSVLIRFTLPSPAG